MAQQEVLDLQHDETCTCMLKESLPASVALQQGSAQKESAGPAGSGVEELEDALAGASAEMREDKELVLAAVARNGLSLRFAAESCRNDKEIAMQAVLQDGAALEFVSLRLRGDKVVVLTALYGLVPVSYGNDGDGSGEDAKKLIRPDDAEAAKKHAQRWEWIAFASPVLLDDHGFMMQEVSRHNAFALQYASERLRRDKELVMAAVSFQTSSSSLCSRSSQAAFKGGSVFQFADASLKKDKTFVLEALRYSGLAFEHVEKGLQFDPEVAVKAYFANPALVHSAAPDVLQDEEVVKALLPRLQSKYIARVMLLSGRACFIYCVLDAPIPKVGIIQNALWKLGMDVGLAARAELLCDGKPLPAMFSFSGKGRLLELQLICNSCS